MGGGGAFGFGLLFPESPLVFVFLAEVELTD